MCLYVFMCVCLCVCLSVCICVCLSVQLKCSSMMFTVGLVKMDLVLQSGTRRATSLLITTHDGYVCLSVCMYVCLSVCLYVCLCVCMSVCVSVCMSVCQSGTPRATSLPTTNVFHDGYRLSLIHTFTHNSLHSVTLTVPPQ